jgi:hypothetical protein
VSSLDSSYEGQLCNAKQDLGSQLNGPSLPSCCLSKLGHAMKSRQVKVKHLKLKHARIVTRVTHSKRACQNLATSHLTI